MTTVMRRVTLKGSSPLARGLHGTADLPQPPSRIIPARAGFTVAVHEAGPGQTDHPRSRGVYLATAWGRQVRRGSSPLARGLPYQALGLLLESRIIPARAGFTLDSRRAAMPPADHPRSRGVYNIKSDLKVNASGSSPLARGLLPLGSIGVLGRGIIPARAGFTCDPAHCKMPYTDHPRSRGVYFNCVATLASDAGSSPLARGLPGPTP